MGNWGKSVRKSWLGKIGIGKKTKWINDDQPLKGVFERRERRGGI